MTIAVMRPASGQAPPPPVHRHGRSISGTPLDTLMHSHLTTIVPEAKDFVRESRPDARTLDYTPLTGVVPTDPDRPKPRDHANVEALQAELEHDGARNAQKARGLAPKRAARHVHPADK